MNRSSRACLLSTVIAVMVFSSAFAQDPIVQPTQQVPEGKRTTLGLYLTSDEAYEAWQATPESVAIIDVRTLEEFIFVGHAEMAWNIPLAVQTDEWNPERNSFTMKPDPTFVTRVQELFKPDDTLFVMCRSGGRSAKAVNLLAEAGFTNVYSIIDGMEGDTVKDTDSVYYGKRMKNGWKNSGSPWTYHIDPQRIRLPAGP